MVKGNSRNKTIKNPNGNFRPKRFADNSRPSFTHDKIFIALDTCVMIDLADYESGHFGKKYGGGRNQKYRNFLNFLLSNSAIENNQFKSSNPIVLITLPVVKQELENGEFFARYMKHFLKNNTIEFKIAQEQIADHIALVKKLSNEYYKKDLFVNEDKTPSLDGAIVAEASKFGLSLLSRDGHICRLSNHQDYQIRNINKRVFANGQQPVRLMTIKNFRTNFNNQQYKFQKPINLDILDLETQRFLYKIDPTLEIDIQEVDKEYNKEKCSAKKKYAVKILEQTALEQIPAVEVQQDNQEHPENTVEIFSKEFCIPSFTPVKTL